MLKNIRVLFSGLMMVAGFGAVFVASVCHAHEYQKDQLAIAHPWARPTPIKTVPAAVYFTITNTGKTADNLLAVAVADGLAKHVEIHESAMEDGMMSMRKIEGKVSLPAGASLTLEPGGKHIMLRGLSKRLVEGDKFSLTLSFEKAGPVEVQVYVENPDGD